MTPVHIPFNRAVFGAAEHAYIAQAIVNMHISGDGPFTQRCAEVLEAETGAIRALLTTSCTHALEMTAMLLDVGPGDEIIMPSFAFVSSANAFVLRGARPVFVDVREDTLNIDERLIEAAITPRTKAIVVIHYGGIACEMDEILEIGKRRGIPVVEDNAHGLFATYRGRKLGSLGALATQSFHETKNITCGEGGALLINDRTLVDRAEIIREKGTNRRRFMRGQVDKYSWVSAGSSWLPSDLLAAVLFAQLESREAIQERRKRIWGRYHQELQGWAEANGVAQPTVPSDREQAYHLYFLLLPDLETRTRFIADLKARGVTSVFHYVPLHTSEMGAGFGYGPGDLPVTESVSDRLARLPLYNDYTPEQQSYVIETVRTFSVER
jgi:dTDP-4-amino-4,6-dideoxygalactose transaminase